MPSLAAQHHSRHRLYARVFSKKDDPKVFTRAWFAWANTLFGELAMMLASERPQVFAGDSGYWSRA